jgi:adenine-specific DNA-methyltransferase
MTDELPEKLPLTSMDVAAEKRDELRRLLKEAFPEAVADEKLDLDQLKRALGEWVEPDRERFGLNWPGKASCMKVIQAPSVGTLKTRYEKSVDWDSTANLFIEGDNLEVLKLMQKAYFGRVKMIYIDPPYNTGKEFIYPDKYSETLDTYLEYTGQKSGDGKRFSTNTDATGRFHSRWLNMMYPRLYLSKNLLAEDGVIFVSIDDNEQANLKLLLDEVYGSENFVGQMVWKNATDNNPTNIAIEHEYIICYAKSRISLQSEWKASNNSAKDILVAKGDELVGIHKDLDFLQSAYNDWFRENRHYLSPLDRYKYIDFDGVYTGSQSVHNPGKEGYRYDVIHPRTGRPCQQPLMGYRFPKDTMDDLIKNGRILFGDDETKIVELKVYAKDYRAKLGSNIILDGRLGAYDLRELFPDMKKTFTNPKPVDLLKDLIAFATKSGDIVLDFFAGSGTIAQSVLELNAEDGGARSFILVQLPEKVDAATYGAESISDLALTRIKRADAVVAAKHPVRKNGGVRVFSLSSSSFVRWEGGEIDDGDNSLLARLVGHVENLDHGAKSDDILFELLLKDGFTLTTKIEIKSLAGAEVFSIADGALLVCLERSLSQAVIDAMADLDPSRVICLDLGFQGNDQLKANAVQTFKARARSRETAIEFRTV